MRTGLTYLVLIMVSCLTLPTLAQEGQIGELSERRLHCMGQSWLLPAYATSEEGELMVRADHPALSHAARAIGRDLHWSSGDLTLSGDEGMSLTVRQGQLGGRDLPIVAQPIEGAVHIPISALEELLTAKVTVKSGAVYLEPVLEAIEFVEDTDSSTVLRLQTSVPVRKKVFTLSAPRRTVVDLVGVALSDKHPGLEHPGIGEIKVGQFQLGPSITRIVIPSGKGVKVDVQRSLDLFEHKLAVDFPAGRVASAQPQPTQTPIEMETDRVETVQIPKVDLPDRKTVKPPTRQQPVVTISRRPLLQSAGWEGNRLKLEFSEAVEYRWSHLSDGHHRFFVDFPGVIFPQKKTQLDSSVPGLKNVRIVQNMPEPEPVVRLVCDLSSPLAVNADSEDERILYLEFPGRRIGRGEALKGLGHTSGEMPKGSAGGRVICLDAGHGGSDPGAINNSVGISEKKVTLDITLRLARILKAEGWNVILTRSVDRDAAWAGSSGKQELGARARAANNHRADLFVSIHCNASPKSTTHGTSLHWYKATDLNLARHLEGSVMHGTGRKNRGLIKNRFYVLAHTTMPAVLIETAFLTNPQEGQLLASPAYRERIARGVAAGLRQYAAHNFPATAAKK